MLIKYAEDEHFVKASKISSKYNKSKSWIGFWLFIHWSCRKIAWSPFLSTSICLVVFPVINISLTLKMKTKYTLFADRSREALEQLVGPKKFKQVSWTVYWFFFEITRHCFFHFSLPLPPGPFLNLLINLYVCCWYCSLKLEKSNHAIRVCFSPS